MPLLRDEKHESGMQFPAKTRRGGHDRGMQMKARTMEEVHAPPDTKPLRVLIVEHSLYDVELMLAELRQAELRVECTLVQDKNQFHTAIETQSFDAILSGYRLPSWTGLDVLRELRESGKDIPLLLVTGTLGEEAAVECIKQGASEFILKENLARLPGALKRAVQESALRRENALAQAALSKSESRLRCIIEAEPQCVKIVDRDGILLEMNPAGLRMVDAENLEQVVGKPVYPLLCSEYRQKFRDLVTHVCQGGSGSLQYEIQGLKGVRRFLETHSAPFLDGHGEIVGALSVTQDITERKRTEEELRLSEARNCDLVENSVYGISRISEDGKFLDANRALLKILGCLSFEDLQIMDLARGIFRFPEQHAELMAHCHQHGQVHGAEAEWRRKDGGIIAARLHVRRLSIPNHPDALEVIVEDVTELRALERQLRQAQKFEAIGQLAGGIAHDFNNVVGAILGWAELGFEQSSGAPQIAERFSRIREQADRAAALTRELLAFARRQVLQPRAVDLNTVASGLVTFLDRVIGKDIELKVVTASLDPVKADPTQIEQVLMNLCLNARDAMPQGGRLVIETEMVQLDGSYCHFYPYVVPGPYVVLSVSDTGKGMDAETRERIFEPFFTTKELGKGTGMGLATVYGIVKQHGGFVHVYSELEHGSLFRVYLPSMEGAVAEVDSARAPVQSLTELRGTETILIAEDHESIREMSRQTLVGLGYRVLSAGDGEEALRLCERERPALAILDVIMPKLSGLKAAEKLAVRFADLPVLFTSGYSADFNGAPSGAYPARYMQKPYSPTTLGRLVREILDHKQSAAQSG
jgi:two-component system cell cycle sensor histidine kinase/response regulator CckA